MSNAADGMNYAPKGKPAPVCGPGEFRFAAVALDHGHIYGMTNGLKEAGAELVKVYDADPAKVAAFRKVHPEAEVASSEAEILEDPTIQLVAAAAVPNLRAGLGMRVMAAGKDYFTDKAPFTTLEQLAEARRLVAETGRKYMVYYSERLHTDSAMYAGELIAQGVIGKVVQVICLAPHRLNAPGRPDWFFRKEQYGGIICDIGSHQIEQILHFSGATDAEISSAAVANYNNPDYPELEDFGEASLVTNNGVSGYFRVDWFTPDGLAVWGDGRTFILGTDGYMELRKYIDVLQDPEGDQIYLVNQTGAQHLSVRGQVGFSFFGQLILDCLNRTENAMTQAHAFKAAELCLQAQAMARKIA